MLCHGGQCLGQSVDGLVSPGLVFRQEPDAGSDVSNGIAQLPDVCTWCSVRVEDFALSHLKLLLPVFGPTDVQGQEIEDAIDFTNPIVTL